MSPNRPGFMKWMFGSIFGKQDDIEQDKELHKHQAHLLIEVDQGFIWQLEGLDGLQDGVPVSAVDVRYKTLDAVHRVQRHRGLLLQGGEGPVQIVLLQVLHDQTDHAGEKTNGCSVPSKHPETKKQLLPSGTCLFNDAIV